MRTYILLTWALGICLISVIAWNPHCDRGLLIRDEIYRHLTSLPQWYLYPHEIEQIKSYEACQNTRYSTESDPTTSNTTPIITTPTDAPEHTSASWPQAVSTSTIATTMLTNTKETKNTFASDANSTKETIGPSDTEKDIPQG
ncbi:hypothetical protein K1T71_005802 [Dendrolimus kikuchii]|uniref:Uncharacterized protein n=1 Tax=Dendrolimus kikuchii TaxID=765133 RepID=A0ACC1D598_9NEOP|nr:hypothetical protein K1T71_005802 [Dendrolimus kikuchii]